MPSVRHEALVELFRNRPELAAKLLRDVLGVSLPVYAEARTDSADLTEVTPAEYRADLVVVLTAERPVLGIIVEVQLDRDDRKLYSWPAYGVNLRARLECPTCVLVVTAGEAVASWCREPISLGPPGATYTLCVLGPDAVPRITDEAVALADLELAMLSVMAHGREPDAETIAEPTLRALGQLWQAHKLDDDRQLLYLDLILSAVGEATKVALEALMLKGYEYQSDFVKKLVAARAELADSRDKALREGREEGREQGRTEALVTALLAFLEARGLTPTDAERDVITSCTDGAKLSSWVRGAASAPSVSALLADD